MREHALRCDVFHLDPVNPGQRIDRLFKTPAQTSLQLNDLQSGTHCSFKSVTKSPVKKNSQGLNLTLSQPEFRPGPELHHISIASPTPAPPSWLLRDQLFNGPEGFKYKEWYRYNYYFNDNLIMI